MDPFRPKWTKTVHFGLANAKIQFGIRAKWTKTWSKCTILVKMMVQYTFRQYRGHSLNCSISLEIFNLIEFFKGRPRGGDNFTSLSKCSRPFLQSVKSTLSHLKSCNPVGGTLSSTAGQSRLKLSISTFRFSPPLVSEVSKRGWREGVGDKQTPKKSQKSSPEMRPHSPKGA